MIKKIHCLVTGRKNESLCGARLVRRKSKKVFFEKFENATFYESQVNCRTCERNMRPHAGKCPRCESEFDTKKDVYCGNCGETTARRRKLDMPKSLKKRQTCKSCKKGGKLCWPSFHKKCALKIANKHVK